LPPLPLSLGADAAGNNKPAPPVPSSRGVGAGDVAADMDAGESSGLACEVAVGGGSVPVSGGIAKVVDAGADTGGRESEVAVEVQSHAVESSRACRADSFPSRTGRAGAGGAVAEHTAGRSQRVSASSGKPGKARVMASGG